SDGTLNRMDSLCSTFAGVQVHKRLRCPVDCIGNRLCECPANRSRYGSLRVLRTRSRAGELRIAWSRTIRAVLQTAKKDLRSATAATHYFASKVGLGSDLVSDQHAIFL